MTENAKNYEANRSKRGGIGCGIRLPVLARAVDYVYNPLGTYVHPQILMTPQDTYDSQGLRIASDLSAYGLTCGYGR